MTDRGTFNAVTTTDITLKITREFDAPRDMVWRAWTEADALMRWYCPKGFTVLFAQNDLRVGGKWRSGMRAPDGSEYIHHGVYHVIDKPQRLIFTHGWEKNELEPAADTVITIMLTEKDGKTTMVFEQVGFANTDSRDSHNAGWSGAFDNMSAMITGNDQLTTDNQIVVSRIIQAPRSLVFKAFSDPEYIRNWWGPRGFTTTTKSMDFRNGGTWRYTMHGPDGTDYPNRIKYLYIHEPDCLIYKHDNDGTEDFEPIDFHTTITLEAFGPDGAQTKITLRSVFPSTEARDLVSKKYGAVEGGIEHVTRLAEYLAKQAAGPALVLALPNDNTIVMRRTFDTPRRLVFDAWTKPEHLKQWWGCADSSLTVCEVDLRVGGAYRFVLQTPDGAEHKVQGVYEQIDPPGKLVFTECYDHPDHGPSKDRTTVTFEEAGGVTTLTVTSVCASRTLRDSHLDSGAIAGAAQSFNKLDGLLESIK